MKRILFTLTLFILSACTSAPSPSPEVPPSAISDTLTLPTFDNSLLAASTPDTSHPSTTLRASLTPDTGSLGAATPTLAPDAWQQMPVVPIVTDTARIIYERGLEMGRDPHRFSKAGDCESTTGWYLAEFDSSPPTYRLGDQYSYLQTTIDYYEGSFKRESIAVRRGANTSSLLTSLWADPTQCEAGESMLACEYRLHNPSIALIAVGSNDVFGVDDFEAQMRAIIEYTISQGIVPVLSTKADNLEGDHRINAILARLAYEYEIPLWNFWLVVQPLPNHGLQADKVHLTFAGNIFDDPFRMEKAWPWRNLTALQVLNALRVVLESSTP